MTHLKPIVCLLGWLRWGVVSFVYFCQCTRLTCQMTSLYYLLWALFIMFWFHTEMSTFWLGGDKESMILSSEKVVFWLLSGTVSGKQYHSQTVKVIFKLKWGTVFNLCFFVEMVPLLRRCKYNGSLGSGTIINICKVLQKQYLKEGPPLFSFSEGLWGPMHHFKDPTGPKEPP